MLDALDFIVLPKDNSEDTWTVMLDGTYWNGFANEDEARDFIEFLVALECTRDAYRKYAGKLRDDFEIERVKKKSSQSFSMS